MEGDKADLAACFFLGTSLGSAPACSNNRVISQSKPITASSSGVTPPAQYWLSWIRQASRPLTVADFGRFVVGFGLSGYVAGHIEVIHVDYLVIDTGATSAPMGGLVVADVIDRYTFLHESP